MRLVAYRLAGNSLRNRQVRLGYFELIWCEEGHRMKEIG